MLTPLFIALAAVTPLLVLTVLLLRWIGRQPEPDRARIRVLRVLLGAVVVIAMIQIGGLFLQHHAGGATGWSAWLSLGAPMLMALAIAASIHDCRNRLARRFPGFPSSPRR